MLYKHYILAVFLITEHKADCECLWSRKMYEHGLLRTKKDTSFSDLFMISFKNKKFDTFNIVNNPEKATTVT